LVLRALEVSILGRGRRKIANPLTTVVLSPFVIAPPIAGVMLWNQNLNAFLATVMFMALFFASYAAAPALIRRFRR
jgi:UDP-GlcNAc:undecaprenyl-phosphate/decaprenyl-phosphate GlcNAc-1-phosphate transferase